MAEKYGWICARCGKSLAPWVRECDCLTAAGDPLIPVPDCPSPWDEINLDDDNWTSPEEVMRKARRHEQDAKKVAV